MFGFIRQFDTPANVAVLSVTAVVILMCALAVLKLKRRRVVPALAAATAVGVAALWMWRHTPHQWDVTHDRAYAFLVSTPLCITRDAFVSQWGNNFPFAEPAGFGGNTPSSVAEYQAHPNDWQKMPAFVQEYGAAWAAHEMPRIVAYAEPGDAIKVTRIIRHYRPDQNDHVDEVRGTLNGHEAEVSLLLVGERGARPCPTEAGSRSVEMRPTRR